MREKDHHNTTLDELLLYKHQSMCRDTAMQEHSCPKFEELYADFFQQMSNEIPENVPVDCSTLTYKILTI
jgi:hypothetical protein